MINVSSSKPHSLQVISSTYFDLKFVLISIIDVLILNTNLAILGVSLVTYGCLSRNLYFKFLSLVYFELRDITH